MWNQQNKEKKGKNIVERRNERCGEKQKQTNKSRGMKRLKIKWMENKKHQKDERDKETN